MTAAKTAAKKTVKKTAGTPVAHGVGRRKSSVARVWLRKGSGVITVNKCEFESYFDTETSRKAAKMPFDVISSAANYDVDVNVVGGGRTGQSDAVKLAISRALVKIDAENKALLREHGLLTVDPRVVERKKPGQPGARRKFQFVKR